MNQSFSLISLSSTLILLLVLNFHGVVVNGDVIDDVCKKDRIDDYDFCVSALESNPKSKTSDLVGLGVISMELCQNNATNLVPYIQNLLNDGKQERPVKRSLVDCLKGYTKAIGLANKALTAFKNKDYRSASDVIIDVDEQSTVCEHAFELRDLTFPFTKQQDDLRQLVSISVEIIALIEGFA